MTVLVDIMVRRTDDPKNKIVRSGIEVVNAGETAAALARVVATTEGGRVRRGKAVVVDDGSVLAGMRLSGYSEEFIKSAAAAVVADTGTVSDAPPPASDSQIKAFAGYPASHYDRTTICGANNVDGTERCATIRGHRGRHGFRKVLASP